MVVFFVRIFLMDSLDSLQCSLSIWYTGHSDKEMFDGKIV